MTNGKITEQFLKSISQRLASREDCKDLTYTVSIKDAGIYMDPIIHVYPDCHHRKDVDKIDVLSFILFTKFPGLDWAERADRFVKGTYKYGLIDNEKKRRWRKTDET